MDQFSYIANAHGSYLDDLYHQYREDPESIDVSWQKFFEGFDFGQQYGGNGNGETDLEEPIQTDVGIPTIDEETKEIRVRALIYAYRTRGHLESDTNPVRQRKDRKARLQLKDFGLSESDLDETFEAGEDIGLGKAKLRDIIDALQDIYLSTIGFEYMYIHHPEEREWFKRKVETEFLKFDPPVEDKKRILEKLNEAVVFENFLHTKYIGQKRFSLEGGETTIPALDACINTGSDHGVEEVVIGMAHRGRLNVLCNIMGKTYAHIFSEFEGTANPDLTMGDGDVKYHMGYSSQVKAKNGQEVNLKLAPNPSHLEAVDPVVGGYTRAKAEALYESDYKKIMPILIHGDAAVAGQGVVYEVIQMSELDGYSIGGTIHFVINNQVGFTTDFDDARSGTYCTEVGKLTDSPVIHVNGDDPEAVVFAMKLATEYRQRYHKDIFVDMVGYRRHGHNESDEPKFTQPKLYNKIAKHPNPREVYSKYLAEHSEVDGDLAKQMDKEFRSLLQDRLSEIKEKPLDYHYQTLEKRWKNLRKSNKDDFDQSPDTGIHEATIEQIGKALTRMPENFKPLKQITKLMKLREEMFFKEKQLNWATAELVAFGSLILEDKLVRMSGQDSVRGTFSSRHSVLFDAETNAPYNSLNFIKEDQPQRFKIYNSLLSEYAVLGFEFGYAMANPNALVVWEAQFGDFANGAQVAIDQFITSSESKWQRMTGLVMLLPHGYEGQGPEHSNARPERFLQLAAEENIQVVNITEPSNYFHALRRQLAWPFRKPLVVMSPKSMLRLPKAVSPIEEFTKGSFQEVLDDPLAEPDKVEKILVVSGKLYWDLLEAREKGGQEHVAIIRLEQLYPFPRKAINALIEKYGKDNPVWWVQEEPENMGAWSYILRIWREQQKDVIARKASASPATGYGKVHKKEQDEIIQKALS